MAGNCAGYLEVAMDAYPLRHGSTVRTCYKKTNAKINEKCVNLPGIPFSKSSKTFSRTDSDGYMVEAIIKQHTKMLNFV